MMNMMCLRSYVYAFCITFLFMVSCTDTDDYDYEYDGDLLFTIKSDTTNEGVDAYTLSLRTEEIYGSVPNYLVHEFEQSPDEMNIHVLTVDRSESMYHALGPADAAIDFEFSREDISTLRFHNSDYIDEYSLQVEADTLLVVVVNSKFTEYIKSPWWAGS